MAALHDELTIAVQSVRAFLIRKIWSTSSTEKNHQSVKSFNVQSLHELIQNDKEHSTIWNCFLSLYHLKEQSSFHHNEQKKAHTLVQYLREVEKGYFPSQDQFLSVFKALKIEINDDGVTILQTDKPIAPMPNNQTNTIVIADENKKPISTELKSLPIYPLQKLILGINTEGALIESAFEVIKPYQAMLQKFYQSSPEYHSSESDHEKMIAIIKIADLFIISEKVNNYHFTNDFEEDLKARHVLLTLKNYHNAILRLKSNPQKNVKYLKEVNDIINAAKSELLIVPDEQLLTLLLEFSKNESDEIATKVLNALDYTLAGTYLEGTVGDFLSNNSEIDRQISQLKHPYYLHGFLEPTMKECPQYDDDLIQELKASFLEESETEIFPLIEATTTNLKTGRYEEADILDLRRAFHTLKGSGYTASLPEIGEIGWQVERVINGVRDNYYPFSDAVLYHALDGYQAISARIKDPNLQDDELQRISYQAQYLIDHAGVVNPEDQLTSAVDDQSLIKIEVLDFQTFDDIPSDFISPYRLYGQDKPSLTEISSLDADLISELKVSMLEETKNEILPALNQLSSSLLSNKATKQDLEKVRHIFHTLKGNSLLIGLNAFGEVSDTIESILGAILDRKFKLSPPITSHIADVYFLIKHSIDNEKYVSYNESQRLFYQGNKLQENAGNITQLLSEQAQIKARAASTTTAEETLSVRRQAMFENIQSVIEQSELSSLDQKAVEELELTDEELSQKLIASFTKCENRTYSALKRYSQDIGLCLLHPNFSQENTTHHQLITSYHKHLLLFRAHGLTPYDERLILWGKILTSVLTIIKTNQIDDSSIHEQIEILQKPILDIEDKSIIDEKGSKGKEAQEEIDPEILQAFFEEAHEVLEHTDEIIQAWQAENYNPKSELIAELRRKMHTLKGGARMVGKEGLGQLSHTLESLLDPNYITLFDSDPKRFEVLQRALDHLQVLLESKNKQLDPEGFNLLSALHLLLGYENPPELTEQGELKGQSTATEVTDKTATAAQSELSTLKITPSQLGDISEKVSENNVLTTRYNNSVSDIMGVLTELSRTMQHLNMTARNIEIETEAQMISRHAKASQNDENFDPLELDQFSELQHLARSVSESIEDLNEFHKHINHSVESMNTSLSKFSGNQTLIADTLTDIGTVSFNSIVPRLRRIVRQVSKSNNKEIELITYGVETQVERIVLEQMTAAFDHMIRNSIIHGIESADKRLALGKPAHGTITLKVSKQGSDLAIELRDDGRGFDVEKIRQKALSEKLISPDETINDNDLVNLTMLPGFTTATYLSEDAGRGVGLDVLTKAMAILKGTATLSFTPNAGVSFKIYIPSTLMILQSLLLNAGGQKYAIPVDNIIGVTQEKDVIFDGKHTQFVYHNDKYDVYDLDKFYSGVVVNHGKDNNYIYLLFEVDGQSIAVGAESIISQLEIIMHPLNPQIANITGLTGSAVTPDGETIFTVDISAFANTSKKPLHRKEIVREETTQMREEPKLKASVMVIDDSITMRRVSQRMLERAGYDVITAKDGLDALEILETHKPDIIMLDIEMPRMDGFEVLTYLRSEDKFMKTPVMMVTSRSGEKHRNRAFEIGANEYCGKPYQEEQILQTIKKLLAQTA